MTAVLTAPVQRVRSALRDPLIRNSVLMLGTTLTMAVVGSIFWVLAARFASRTAVGLGSSLVTTAEALGIFALLGLEVTVLRTMPRSDRRASDAVIASGIVAGAGAVLAVGYAALLPAVAPDLADVVTWPWLAPVFAILVAGTAVNMLTDSMFLAIDRVVSNFWINGVVLSVVKLALPFALVGVGGFAVFGAVGGAASLAAAVSLFAILRHLPDRPTLRPSQAFRTAGRFAGAGYVSHALYITPQLVFPVLIINARGPASSAVFFVCFQIVTLLNHAVYTFSSAMYAEVSRDPRNGTAIVRKAGRTIALVSGAGIVALGLAAPLLLAVFGRGYADSGTTTLRVLALGTIGVALNYWSAVRLRIAHHLPAMIGVQLFTTILMIALAAVAAPHGIEAVAGAWGVGQLVGGVVGYAVSRTIAPMSRGLALTPQPADAPPVPAGAIEGVA